MPRRGKLDLEKIRASLNTPCPHRAAKAGGGVRRRRATKTQQAPREAPETLVRRWRECQAGRRVSGGGAGSCGAECGRAGAAEIRSELANNVDAMTDSHLDRALQQLGVWVPMTNGRMWRDS